MSRLRSLVVDLSMLIVSTLAGVTPHTSSSLQVSSIELEISERFGRFLPGCYVSSGRLDEAQSLLDKIPHSINHRRRTMPTEVFIKKKCMSRISQT